jgi:hypothetical protein
MGLAGPPSTKFGTSSRFLIGQHVVEVARVGIDDDRARRFLAMIRHNGALEILWNVRLLVRRIGEQLLVARSEIGLGGRFQLCVHASAEEKPGQKQCNPPYRHTCPLTPFGAPLP